MGIESDDVCWVVNTLGELGVEIQGQVFFLYKGYSLQYEDVDVDGEGSPLMYRSVGKRKFGEVCHPFDWWQRCHRCGDCNYPDGYPEGVGWKPLPVKTSKAP